MASTIPPPHILFVPSSSSLLDVPRPDALHPFSSSLASSILVFVLVFCCITFLSISVFFGVFFFFSFCRSSPRRFRCPPSIAGLFSRPHHDELPPCSSLYGVNVHTIGFFPCISFCLYSIMLFLFSLYFVCYFLVIML